MAVTAFVLQQRALLIAKAMVNASEHENYCALLSSFEALTGWMTNFVKQWSICSVSLPGEGGSTNASQVAADIPKLRKTFAEFDSSCIFNADETGLFFKSLPRRTYISTFADKKHCVKLKQ